jgi:hypothetical protein
MVYGREIDHPIERVEQALLHDQYSFRIEGFLTNFHDVLQLAASSQRAALLEFHSKKESSRPKAKRRFNITFITTLNVRIDVAHSQPKNHWAELGTQVDLCQPID